MTKLDHVKPRRLNVKCDKMNAVEHIFNFDYYMGLINDAFTAIKIYFSVDHYARYFSSSKHTLYRSHRPSQLSETQDE